jgi:hypothetical protein
VSDKRSLGKRIFERLRDEHGFKGGITIVTDYVREAPSTDGREVCAAFPSAAIDQHSILLDCMLVDRSL